MSPSALDFKGALTAIGGNKDSLLTYLESFDNFINEKTYPLHKAIMKRKSDEIQKCTPVFEMTFIEVAANKIYTLTSEIQKKASERTRIDFIVQDYIKFLHEAKQLKKDIAEALHRPPASNIMDFDIFEKQVKKEFSSISPQKIEMSYSIENKNPICQGCNIF